MDIDKKYFTKQLIHWNKHQNTRLMPWKGEKDPYKIWLSEIILQQTRVEQGWNYYNRFVTTFPTVQKLAAAPQEKVFKLWEGLGYYTRCKNLLATAKSIAVNKKRVFPNTYDEILSLKGIGPYTAAAIASFAFNLPHAVVDGNVFRVLSRYFAIDTPVNSTAGKKLFTELAQELLHQKQPGIYNQAIMDFGATVCRPQNPLCTSCPLKSRCAALLRGKTGLLPVKTGKLIKKQRWLYYLVVSYDGKLYVRKRAAKQIWENLYEFVLLETDRPFSFEEIEASPLYKNITGKSKATVLHISKMYKQQLTHQTIQGGFIQLAVSKQPPLQEYKAVTYTAFKKLPLPRFITTYLAQNALKAFES